MPRSKTTGTTRTKWPIRLQDQRTSDSKIVIIGSQVGGFTPGRVIFSGSAGTLAHSPGLTWDDANRYLTVSKAGQARIQLIDTGSSNFPWFLQTFDAGGTLYFGRESLSSPADFHIKVGWKFNEAVISGTDVEMVSFGNMAGNLATGQHILSISLDGGFLNLVSSLAGGVGPITFGQRPTDQSTAVGVTAEFWPTTAQTIPVICTVDPGLGTFIGHAPVYRWGVMPNGDVQHYVVGSKIYWNGRSEILSPADGVILLRDTAGTGFSRLVLGGTSSSFPAVKRNSATLESRLADDSAYAEFRALRAIVDAAERFGWAGRSRITSPADGQILLIDDAATAFSRLMFGGTSSSFPALKRNTVVLEVKLADDSAFAEVRALRLVVDAGERVGWSGRSRITSPADSDLLLQNDAAAAFNMLKLGGTSSSFPALKRNAAVLETKLADDSAYAQHKALEFSSSSAAFLMRTSVAWNNGAGASAGTLTNAPAAGDPTKWIPVDDNGTTRFVPAW